MRKAATIQDSSQLADFARAMQTTEMWLEKIPPLTRMYDVTITFSGSDRAGLRLVFSTIRDSPGTILVEDPKETLSTFTNQILLSDWMRQIGIPQ